MPIFHKNPEKSVTGLLKRLDQAMAKSVGPMYESRDSDPMVRDFMEMRQAMEKMKEELGQANVWEKNVKYGYFDLVKQVQKFYTAAHDNEPEGNMRSKLQLVAKSAKHLQNSISVIQSTAPCYTNQEKTDSEAFFQLPPKAWKLSQEWLELGVEEQILGSSQTNILATLRRSYESLEQLETRLCLLCLSIFPNDAVLKKRLLIYWWIGEGIITDYIESDSEDYKTAEEVGDDMFDELVGKGLVAAVKDGSCPSCRNVNNPICPIVNRCRMNPWIRDMLVSLAREADFFDFDPSGKPSDSFSNSGRSCLVSSNQIFLPSASTSSSSRDGNKEEQLWTVFNVSEEILGFRIDWLSRLKKIVVLQLGRWQYWCEHHIEVENDEQLFKGLGSQKLLKYLSLRGISRIFALPSSISGLLNLEILDLKACHNLETLPDLSSLKKLTHLDMSECYLLESMPKGIAKLTSLQVLKGFVIGNSKRNTCKLRDLARLKKLRRLSIYLGRYAVLDKGGDECDALKEITSLRCLTITWGTSQENKESLSYELSLPESIRKLDLRGFPLHKPPTWLKPSGFKMLEKLYIRGGELKSLESDQGETERWGVQILRLKFIRKFEMGLAQLKQTFPNLKYLERIGYHNKDNNPPEGDSKEGECCHRNIVWSKSAEEEEKCSVEDVVRSESMADDEKGSDKDGVSPEGPAEKEKYNVEDVVEPNDAGSAENVVKPEFAVEKVKCSVEKPKDAAKEEQCNAREIARRNEMLTM